MFKFLKWNFYLGLTVLMTLTGCSSNYSPEPLFERSVSQLQTESDSIILNEIIKDIIEEKLAQNPFETSSFNAAGPYTSKAYINNKSIKYLALHGLYIYTFSVNNSNELVIIDESRNRSYGDLSPYCFACNDHGFTKYMEQLISDIKIEMNNRVAIYDSNLSTYRSLMKAEVPMIEDSVEMELSDPKGLLPHNVLNEIRNFKVTHTAPKNLPKEYSKSAYTDFPINIQAFFNGCNRLSCTHGRFREISLAGGFIDGIYNQVSHKASGEVLSASYQLNPQSEFFSDDNLNVEATSNSLGFTNTSRQTIYISNYSIYVDNEVRTAPVSIQLPPNTKASHWLGFLDTRLINKLTKPIIPGRTINGSFGISLTYKIDGVDTTLYSVKEYSYSG